MSALSCIITIINIQSGFKLYQKVPACAYTPKSYTAVYKILFKGCVLLNATSADK